MMSRRVFDILFVLLFVPAGAFCDEWKILEIKDGIEVALREQPGRDLPTMRGRTVLNGDIDRLVAILRDPDQATEWAEGASEVTLISRDDSRDIVHTYIDLVWPVWDREIVSSSKLQTVDAGNEYILSSAAVPGFVPEKEGIIRIKDGTTHFHLKKRAPGKVWVEYLVNVDPAGDIPRWLVRWTAESVPSRTLKKLQNQLDKRGG